MLRSRLEAEAMKALADACAGYTQLELKAMTGVNQGTISKMLNGLHAPRLDTVEKILDALGYDVELRVTKRH